MDIVEIGSVPGRLTGTDPAGRVVATFAQGSRFSAPLLLPWVLDHAIMVTDEVWFVRSRALLAGFPLRRPICPPTDA